jgi:hypothetical protein
MIGAVTKTLPDLLNTGSFGKVTVQFRNEGSADGRLLRLPVSATISDLLEAAEL